MGRSSNSPRPPETLQAIPDLLFLEGELGVVGHVLEAAPPAAAEVGARRRDPVGRGLLDGLDLGAAEAGTGVDHPHREPVTGEPAAHEDHVAAGATDTLPPEGEVVDANGDTITASGFCHDAATIKSGPERVN